MLPGATRTLMFGSPRLKLLQGSTWGLRWVVVALNMGGLASGDAKLLVISSPAFR
jgi:hypothetical protein